MKSILLTIVICFTSLFGMLEAQVQVTKDTLSVSEVIGIEQRIDFRDYEIMFKEVITDSRCPKSVMCIRAGEAKVLVSIYKKGKFIEDKQIRIDASGYVLKSSNLAINAKDFKAYGYSLSPYPNGVNGIEDEAYRLELVFQFED